MSAPRKVHKEQSVKIRFIQSLTNSAEVTNALALLNKYSVIEEMDINREFSHIRSL